MAQCLQAHLRDCDMLDRVGGEEFAVFLPDTPLHGTVHVAEELCQAVAALHIIVAPETQLAVTASLGVTAQRDASSSLADMLHQADQATYQAKAMGRSQGGGVPDRLIAGPRAGRFYNR